MTTKQLDAEIEELETQLGMGDKTRPFDVQAFDKEVMLNSYPKCVIDQVNQGNTILFGGINFDNLTQTEIAILFVRNFSGMDRWKEIREKHRQDYLESAKPKNSGSVEDRAIQEETPSEKKAEGVQAETPQDQKPTDLQIEEGGDRPDTIQQEVPANQLQEDVAPNGLPVKASNPEVPDQSLVPVKSTYDPKLTAETKIDQSCICENYNDFKDWDQVQCDNCDVWYHQFCVKLTCTPVTLLTRFDGSLKWFCFRCMNK